MVRFSFLAKLILDSDYTILEYQNSIFYLGLLGFIFFLSWIIQNGRLEEETILIKSKLYHKELFKSAPEILNNFFPYYRDLEPKLKRKFLRRVEIFIGLKQFIPRQCEKNDKVYLLIAATAVQLTFGLNNFSIYRFDKILIYPDIYYSSIRKTYHKGEINVKQKLIVLSSKHFLEGVQDANDGLNLGLHEFSHALHVNSFKDRTKDFIINFKKWESFAVIEMEKIEESSTHFLRKYAATNIPEMFAVCTENFFERSEQFQSELPKIYKSLVVLFNQNPINKSRPVNINLNS